MGDDEAPDDIILSKYPHARDVIYSTQLRDRGVYLGEGTLMVIDVMARTIEMMNTRLQSLERDHQLEKEHMRRVIYGG